jgi:hypothetical protein
VRGARGGACTVELPVRAVVLFYFAPHHQRAAGRVRAQRHLHLRRVLAALDELGHLVAAAQQLRRTAPPAI